MLACFRKLRPSTVFGVHDRCAGGCTTLPSLSLGSGVPLRSFRATASPRVRVERSWISARKSFTSSFTGVARLRASAASSSIRSAA